MVSVQSVIESGQRRFDNSFPGNRFVPTRSARIEQFL